jgi:hypothetical protein
MASNRLGLISKHAPGLSPLVKRIATVNDMRHLEMKWTSRNVNRVHKWLNLQSDMSGRLYRNREYVGYKQTGRNNKTIIFYLFTHNKIT